MVLAALLDLGVDGAGLDPAPVTSRCEVGGVRALRVAPAPRGPMHRTRAQIQDILAAQARNRAVLRCAADIFDILARAEAESHGGDPESVRFHEVGQDDSILDVLGFAHCLDTLGWPTVHVSALPSATSSVQTEHGLLACPVPAVCHIRDRYGLRFYDVASAGESITPTGAAIAAWAVPLAEAVPVSARVGAGAGQRSFPDRPNILRAYAW
jgi:uncharacterized protein (DUF111 family)